MKKALTQNKFLVLGNLVMILIKYFIGFPSFSLFPIQFITQIAWWLLISYGIPILGITLLILGYYKLLKSKNVQKNVFVIGALLLTIVNIVAIDMIISLISIVLCVLFAPQSCFFY